MHLPNPPHRDNALANALQVWYLLLLEVSLALDAAAIKDACCYW